MKKVILSLSMAALLLGGSAALVTSAQAAPKVSAESHKKHKRGKKHKKLSAKSTPVPGRN